MSLKHCKLNGHLVTVQYTRDANDEFNITVDKVFYKELDIAPVLYEDVLDQLADEIWRDASE
jgi:hypothetical protein